MKPMATYRVQFHAGFPFAAGKELAPYLQRLGVTHLYASPITTARKGSLHGYDVVDPTRINPELGGEDGLRDMVEGLRGCDLGLIVDIVPNHMAVGGDDNPWWLDMLEGGEAGPLASFFDVDWRPDDPTLHGKVLAPFLGTSYAKALASGDIVLSYDAQSARLSAVTGGSNLFPIRRQDYGEVLRDGPSGLNALYDGTTAQGRERLHVLLERQNFRLASWRTAGDEINWRRFFDVTELAGLQTDRADVFQTIHTKIFELYAEGLIDGVRVDHIDGLADPAGYCRSLRERLSGLDQARPADRREGRALIVVEKILAPDERLSDAWLTDGTTGYDYMDDASALLHDEAGREALTTAWTDVSRRSPDFAVEASAARLEVLGRRFAGQLDAAARAFWRLSQSRLETRDITFGSLRRVVSTLLGVFPCYRTYASGAVDDPSDQGRIQMALAAAQPLTDGADFEALAWVGRWLLGRPPEPAAPLRAAVRRFQQLSSPIAAKAVEDTAFYRYSRLLSRNDVGFDPGRLAMSAEVYHGRNLERAKAFPRALLATATHDHKRGEDVRARLAVLSEVPGLWTSVCARLDAKRQSLSSDIDHGDIYAIYQTLVGALPYRLEPADEAGLADFCKRADGWLQKALREAKLRSSWSTPNLDYEARCSAFLAALLDPSASKAFLSELFGFRDRIGAPAAMNGIVQAVLRCFAPGAPDLYQGAEFWDLSLVDPDNRRPVDFEARRSALLEDTPKAVLLEAWRDGRIKQRLICDALKLRRAAPAVFCGGAYVPAPIIGPRADHAIAFVRAKGAEAVLVVAALRCAEPLLGAERPLPPTSFWEDTAVDLPAPFSLKAAQGASLTLASLLAEAPAAAFTLAVNPPG